MFNLIVTIISIALIAVLAVASIYYGGDAFRSGSAKAAAAQLVNGAQQVSGANVLYANDNGGANASGLSDLTTDGAYLASAPQVPSGVNDGADTPASTLDLTDGVVSAVGLSTEVCEAVNKQAGYTQTETEAFSSVDDASANGFGCYDDTTTRTFVFK